MNKSLGRTPVKVFIHDDSGNETLSQDYYQYYTGYSIKELAEALFPWAAARVDDEFYEMNTQFEETDEDRFMRAIDEDNGFFRDARDPEDVFPYAETSGEIEHYRLRLELNNLGESFLVVSDHLGGD